jgi:hypothetical protein
MHHGGTFLNDDDLAALVAKVRASTVRATSIAFDDLEASLPEPITSLSLRTWAASFPTDIATQRRVPYEARADAIMYRRVLAELGSERGWQIHLYDAKTVEVELASLLGESAENILRGPRQLLGPPWSKDHRVSLAATIVAGEANSTRNVEGLPR